MKTLILYATKHGATADIAGRIADKMGDVVLHNIADGGSPSLHEFDCIIIGSSIYAGSIRKELKRFLARNADDQWSSLRVKPLGIFLSGFDGKDEVFTKNFSAPILQAAKVKAFLGGIFDPAKASGFERAIIKAVMKQTDYTSSIDDEKIAQFVQEIKR